MQSSCPLRQRSIICDFPRWMKSKKGWASLTCFAHPPLTDDCPGCYVAKGKLSPDRQGQSLSDISGQTCAAWLGQSRREGCESFICRQLVQWPSHLHLCSRKGIKTSGKKLDFVDVAVYSGETQEIEKQILGVNKILTWLWLDRGQLWGNVVDHCRWQISG